MTACGPLGRLEDRVHARVDGQMGQADQLGVRLVHDDVDAGDHLGQGRDRDVREDLVGGVDEGDVRGIPEVEELEVVLPHLQAHVDELVVLGEQVVAAADPGVLEDQRLVLDLGQPVEMHGVELGDQLVHLDFPGLVQRVPVLVVEPGAFHERGHALLDLLGVRYAHRGDVDIPVDNAVVDAERRWHEEGPSVVLGQSEEPGLVPQQVERVMRLGVVQTVVEPQLIVLELRPLRVVRAELVVVGEQLLPSLGAGDGGHLMWAEKLRAGVG